MKRIIYFLLLIGITVSANAQEFELLSKVNSVDLKSKTVDIYAVEYDFAENAKVIKADGRLGSIIDIRKGNVVNFKYKQDETGRTILLLKIMPKGTRFDET